MNTTINISKNNVRIPTLTTVIYTSLATPADQYISIPSNIVGTVNIKCWGAGGGTVGKGTFTTIRKTGRGGGGGYTEGNFINIAGQTLTIIVGEDGKTNNTGTSALATYGGGGGQNLGGDAHWGSASGGGRSAVRLSDATEIITAGGGGGGGGTVLTTASVGVCDGGAGGGLTGGDGEKSNPISGTTSVVPTTTDYNGKGGKSNIGGNAVTCDVASSSAGTQYTGGFGSIFAPGGGGGWYGGSGGGSTKAPTNQWIFAGGGGGSSNINTTFGTLVQMTQASGSTVAAADKLPAGYSSSNIGSGGVPTAIAGTDNGTNGQPGLVVITYTA